MPTSGSACPERHDPVLTDTARHHDAIGASSHLAGRDGGLDLLRGVTALSVVLFDLWITPGPRHRRRARLTDAIWSAGRLGLVVFFVLSGYLL